MSIKSIGKKFQGGANLSHPELTVWGVLRITASVIAVLIGFEIGRYLLGRSKKAVGGVVPGVGGGGMADARGSLGI